MQTPSDPPSGAVCALAIADAELARETRFRLAVLPCPVCGMDSAGDHPLIVLTDTIQGVEAARQARPAGPTRVVILCGPPDDEFSAAAFAAGADESISHPFDIGEPVATMRRQLEMLSASE